MVTRTVNATTGPVPRGAMFGHYKGLFFALFAGFAVPPRGPGGTANPANRKVI